MFHVNTMFQVNTNGFISLAEPTGESEYLGKMPASFGMIAAFLGDLDTTDGAGYVYFRQDKSPDVLQRVAEHISQAFPSDDEIEPTHAIIVTWENVAPQGERGPGGEYAVRPSSLNAINVIKLLSRHKSVYKSSHLYLSFYCIAVCKNMQLLFCNKQENTKYAVFLLQYALICKVIVLQHATVCSFVLQCA